MYDSKIHEIAQAVAENKTTMTVLAIILVTLIFGYIALAISKTGYDRR